ncbi:MAG TPA: NAD(+) synthase [Bacilli bacterium]|nr:NAD(+) synthase [Bacilli bacterium]
MYSQGFVKVASVSPTVRVGDPFFNVKQIIKTLEQINNKASFACFPELAVSGYSVGDLIYQTYLYDLSCQAIAYFLKNNPYEGVIILGGLFRYNDVMYNCSFVIQKDKILGIVPKVYLPHSNEFYETRWFNSGMEIMEQVHKVTFLGKEVPFGKIIFVDQNHEVKFGVEICADLWAPISPHDKLYANGALLIFNSSASNDYVGKEKARRLIIQSASYKWNGAYIYSSTSKTESTSEVVFSGHKIISQNGEIINESDSFNSSDEIIYGDIDISYLKFARVNNSWYKIVQDQLRDTAYQEVEYQILKTKDYVFEKYFELLPFVPKEKEAFQKIINIQAASIKKRLDYIGIKKVVLGVSGGLDSTLALLSLCYAFDKYGFDRKGIIAVTLPTENTSQNTLTLARKLMQGLKVTAKEININDNIDPILLQIGHSKTEKDITYENVQARYRTMILMNLANLNQAIVIGTTDMSELALGWMTFNADHMAMYNINVGLTKTVVRKTVEYYKEIYPEVSDILDEVINLPISPELAKDQKTEDIIGKYEINDFILYRFLKNGDSPSRITYLLTKGFNLTEQEAHKYVKNFYKRFYSQQYKRLSSPEGVKILDLSLSPRTEVRLNGDIYFSEEE